MEPGGQTATASVTTGDPSSVSSTGATLSGSYTGATGEVTETGFYYGTSSGSLTIKVSSTGSATPFSTVLADLASGTIYYYKAYVKEGSEEVFGTVKSFTTKAVATATVTTQAASSIIGTMATLNGSYSGATGTIQDRGFRYRKQGTSSWTRVGINGTSASSGQFSKEITGLTENTTYEFQAYVVEFDASLGATGTYVDRWASNTLTFTTANSTQIGLNYLSSYEVPSIPTLNGQGTSGLYSAKEDNWYRHYTTNSKQQVATHSFKHPDSQKWVRNYTVLYDETRYAPLWCAHAMHKSMWPDYNVGRNDNWGDDPAISLTQQSGLDNASSVGYSRGHLVSSGERQSTRYQNKQTFYYSNQAPQRQNKFNGSIWGQLENAVISAAPAANSRDTLYVVTGVLYEYSGNPTTKPSGSLNVPIPTHFYKCVMLCSFDGSGNVTAANGVAYLFENKDYSNNNYSAYATTIDEVESRAGFDFFRRIPESLQTEAENGTNSLSL